MPFGPLGPSLAPYLKSSRTLYGWIKPIANWYAKASGYRKYGFKYDDLLIEERDNVQRALARLTPREKHDRAFRLKRASQASVLHAPLAQKEWTKVEEASAVLMHKVNSLTGSWPGCSLSQAPCGRYFERECGEGKTDNFLLTPMHPQLSEKKLVCQEFIKALEECHSGGWSRFIGACNKHKDELNNCLHTERLKKAAANREDSKVRKAKAKQASQAFYED